MIALVSAFRNITKVLLLVGVLLLASIVSAQTFEESIPLYEVEIIPKPDGSFSVTENIYYDFARYYKHGVTRGIPTQHSQASSAFYKQRYNEIVIHSTKKDDEDIIYEATDLGDELFIKVGDPNDTMTSEHKFTISYDVFGGLHYYDDGPTELYWDAIGSESSVEILKAVVTVKDEHGLLTGQSSCYVGQFGSGDTCGEVVVAGNLHKYEMEDLGKFTGVTVAFALNDSLPFVAKEKNNYWYFIIPSSLIALFVFIFGIYRYRTEYRTNRPVIAQYEPYEGLKPMYTGVLLDDVLHPSDITACIVYLAAQGYLKIKKTERKFMWLFEVDDYEVTLTKQPKGELSRFQEDVLSLLFSSLAVGESVLLSKLSSDYSKKQANHKLITKLRRDIKKDLSDEGFFQNLSWEQLRPLLAFGVGITAVAFIIFAPLAILFVIFGLLFIVVSRRRTRKGYEALNHLKGFKEFLSTTEKERYKFHNSPEKNPEQFMEYLPYAIAFGVEDKWAEVFKDVTIPDPEWYQGNGGGHFSAVNFTKSVSSFSTAFASSSGSSGSGGSSGGGSVGGGGGGGSVGSW